MVITPRIITVLHQTKNIIDMNDERKGIVLQFTGKSYTGKTTIAKSMARYLGRLGYKIKIIDENDYNTTLNRDLGDTKLEKEEALRRMFKFANILRTDFDIIIVSAINPYDDLRNEFKEKHNFLIIHIDCENETLINRDIHGNINRLIKHDLDLDGFDVLESDFEKVTNADLVINTSNMSVNDAFEELMNFLSVDFFHSAQLSHFN